MRERDRDRESGRKIEKRGGFCMTIPCHYSYSINPESFKFCFIIMSLQVSKTCLTFFVSVAHVT
jgi:hypothetical protein